MKSFKNSLRYQILCAWSLLFLFREWGRLGKTQVAIRVCQVFLQNKESKKSVIFIEKQDKLMDVCSEILRRLSGRRFSERHDLVSIAKRRLKELREDTVVVLDNTEEIQGKEFDDFAEYLLKYAPRLQLILTSREGVGLTSPRVHRVSLYPASSVVGYHCFLFTVRAYSRTASTPKF